jgi:hypothetical protein
MTPGTASFTSVMKSRTPGAKSPAVMTTSVRLLIGIYVPTNVAVPHRKAIVKPAASGRHLFLAAHFAKTAKISILFRHF